MNERKTATGDAGSTYSSSSEILLELGLPEFAPGTLDRSGKLTEPGPKNLPDKQT